MSFWDAVPALLAVGATAADYIGSKEATKGLEEGTREGEAKQAALEKLNRDYAQKIFDEDIERQKPFYDAGIKAGVQYSDAITNKLDPTQSGAYKTQLGLISPELEGAPEYVREEAIQRLGAIEGEKQKGRLLDLQQIGMGAAGAAGTSGMNLGNVLAQSFGRTSGAGFQTAQNLQTVGEQRQSAFNVAASQLSGLPAYLASSRSPQTQYGGSPYTTQQNPLGLTPGQGL